MDTIIDRLAIPHERLETTSVDKARQNLIETLENGRVPIVWADMYLLPYNGLKYDENNWAMMPVVVYGYEPERNEAFLADRACLGLTVPAMALDAARARVKKDRHLQLTLEYPDNRRLIRRILDRNPVQGVKESASIPVLFSSNTRSLSSICSTYDNPPALLTDN